MSDTSDDFFFSPAKKMVVGLKNMEPKEFSQSQNLLVIIVIVIKLSSEQSCLSAVRFSYLTNCINWLYMV
jgi:hypothetical protein